MENHRRHSFFWPIILVGVGLIWLLINLGYVPAISIGQVLKFWPVLLIVLGMDMILGRRFPWAGTLIGLLAVAGVIAFLLMSPNLGIQAAPQMQTETFSAPIGTASSAKVYLEASSAPVTLDALDSGDELVHAVITHRSILNFNVSGSSTKVVRLSETTDPNSWLNWNFTGETPKWNVQLAKTVPMDVVVDGGSGSLDLNLGEIQLSSLLADMGSGSSDIILPAVAAPYQVTLDSGSGSVSVKVPEGAAFTFSLSSGSGSVNVELPTNAALQVEVFDEGSGSLHLPSGLERVSAAGSGNSLGVWQTAGFSTATTKIYIKILDQGSGSINIHE